MGAAMATVNSMVREFGSDVKDILVAVGPSVGVCCYTMNRHQVQDFTKIHPDCVPDPESAQPHVNIRLANRYGPESHVVMVTVTVQILLMSEGDTSPYGGQ